MIGGFDLFRGDMLGSKDHGPKHELTEVAGTLDGWDLRAIGFEVGEDVQPTLVARDVIGETSLVPLLDRDKLGTRSFEDRLYVINHATHVCSGGLGEEEHALVDSVSDFAHRCHSCCDAAVYGAWGAENPPVRSDRCRISRPPSG